MSTTYLYRHRSFTSFHGGLVSQSKKQKVSCSNPSIIVYLQHLSQVRLKKKQKSTEHLQDVHTANTHTTSISLKALQNLLKLCCKYFKTWGNCSLWATGTVQCFPDYSAKRHLQKPVEISTRMSSTGRINFLRYSEPQQTVLKMKNSIT